ncbi:MAG: hypothetical protein M1826_006029 [Phylliscum demangeonii]|nr:MAG: hypothetical protein M1826_006029 [Phylliscum demangeonii]
MALLTPFRISGYVDQASIQVGVLGELIKAVRLGRCSGSAGVPKSVVLVGHSFGSVISNAIVASIPGAADGLILTGLGYTGFDFKTIWGTLQARLPSQEQHDMLANLDTGYLDAGDLYSFVGGQFHQPNYDVQVARNAFSRRQLFAVTEIPSSAQHSLLADKFTGPVMVISGEFDLPVCGGYCPDVLEAGAAPVFPASRNFKAYVQPNTGHALNLHKNATAGYAVITDFLASNGF